MGLLLETYVMLGVPIEINSITFLVFFSTLFIYSLHRLIAYRRIPEDQRGPITSWAARNYFSLFMMVVIGAGGTAIMAFHLSRGQFFALLIPAFISVFYELPVVKKSNTYIKLRNLKLAKIFLITAVWGFITVALPALENNFSLLNYQVLLIMLNRMLFILPIALCFDVRDMIHDQKEGVETLPIRIGIEKMPRLYVQLIAAFMLLSVIQFGFLPAFRPAMIVSLIVSGYFSYQIIKPTYPRRSDFYYTIAVDGLMYTQFLLVWVLNGISSWHYTFF